MRSPRKKSILAPTPDIEKKPALINPENEY